MTWPFRLSRPGVFGNEEKPASVKVDEFLLTIGLVLCYSTNAGMSGQPDDINKESTFECIRRAPESANDENEDCTGPSYFGSPGSDADRFGSCR
jgi:hypothetical protein